MNEIQRRTVAGAVSLPGVNIMSHHRCGDADRQRAADRVSEAYARGFIEKEEAESRHDAIAQASLGAHLEELTRDIPVMSRFRGATLSERRETRAEEWVRWWKARQPWIGLASCATGITGGVLPTVLATVFHGGAWVAVCAATTIPVFGLTALGSLISLMVWSVEL